jgi:transcriptional regulator with XRE-family HTH domain
MEVFMNTNFARTLSLLRKEKGFSQKSAASHLKISQALLSHYENGVREPGLSFVVDAADFYGVSVDFLLGRTMSRDGTAINVNDLHDTADDKDNILRGSAMSLFSKKIIVNAVGILFDLLGRMENRALVQHAYSFLSTSIYKLFRQIYAKCGKNPEAFFAVPSKNFSDLSDANIKLCELHFKTELEAQADTVPLSNDSLTRDYPLLVQSLLSLLHSTEKDIGKLN